METIREQLQKTTARCRSLDKCLRLQHSRLQARVERVWTIGTIVLCHAPDDGQQIVMALKQKYAEILPACPSDCLIEIEKRYLETSVEQLAEWLQWEGMPSQIMMKEVKHILEDARLHVWICKQNDVQGIAPPPQFVWKKRCSLFEDLHDDAPVASSVMQSPKSEAARKWVQRFRLRWHLTLGRQPAKDLLPVETMKFKVLLTHGFRKI